MGRCEEKGRIGGKIGEGDEEGEGEKQVNEEGEKEEEEKEWGERRRRWRIIQMYLKMASRHSAAAFLHILL